MTDDWVAYYKAVEGRAPRALFTRALSHVAGAGVALELGCGDGTESLSLLAAGWEVHAFDVTAEGIALLRRRVPNGLTARLHTAVTPLEDAALPPADLIYAGLSLPFVTPQAVPHAWTAARAALRPGGVFACHLFGDRDGWSSEPGMTFHGLASVEGLLVGLDVLEVVEDEDDHPAAFEASKHWHVFEVLAREPDANA